MVRKNVLGMNAACAAPMPGASVVRLRVMTAPSEPMTVFVGDAGVLW